MQTATENILVIKHGALGDIILATGPFKAIREHHPSAHITLLTTAPYAELLEKTGWFDEIWIDVKPEWHQFREWKKLQRRLNSGQFDRVYDIQTSSRSSFYLKLFRNPKPEWSGIAPGASHLHDTPHRTQWHTLDREREQLNLAGIKEVPGPDLSWLSGDISTFQLRTPYAILVPGGSAHRPEKRWPMRHYATLCDMLKQRGIQPILLGSKAESDLLNDIEKASPGTLNLCQQTTFGQIAELARHAIFAVGNDTGPTHIIASCGCPSLILFSNASNPSKCAPRGENVRILQSDDLADLTPEQVLAAIP